MAEYAGPICIVVGLIMIIRGWRGLSLDVRRETQRRGKANL